MALSKGTRLGPYEIVSPLGAGGMGEVYRARDTRLDRTVAVKVLNSQLVASFEVRARFEREARVISQLQHPHICTLHDVGSSDGTDFLVMEYLEGESLSDRLKKGALPLQELLKIAIQIADALEKAHRAGIIHRDLKPGNVMLTKSGAKLLDFGLAKPLSAGVSATGSGASASVLTAALTQTSPYPSPAAALSGAGSVVGTVQYMAPEQVQGLPTDARSDIFSFGALLFEMATGQRAFHGKTAGSIIGQILAVDPPAASTLQPELPPALDRTIRICLEKDPDERFQSAHDLKLQLESVPGTSVTITPAIDQRSRWISLLAIAAVLLLAIAAGLYLTRPAQQPKLVYRTSLLPPDKVVFSVPDGVPVLSPDGTKLAFVGLDEKGIRMLYVRLLDSLTAQPLSGTEGANFPFWSPDSRNLGFFAGGKLKRIDAQGGPTQELADANGLKRGGSWNQSGNIIFATDLGQVLREVPAVGGTVSVASKLAPAGKDTSAEGSHYWPHFLPDGKHFLFWKSPSHQIAVGELGSLEHKDLFPSDTEAEYANGYIIFIRRATLMAQPFDLQQLSTTGEAIPLADHIFRNATVGGSGIFSLSSNGALVYQGGQLGAGWPLDWYDRDGKATGKLGEPASYSGPVISPDGKRVAVTISTQGNEGDIWIYDLSRGTRMRLTFDGTNGFPAWSADGKQVLYFSPINLSYYTGVHSKTSLYAKPADNSGEAVELAKDVTGAAWNSVSRDGRFMAFMRWGNGTSFDIWAVPLQGDHKPFPVLQNKYLEGLPAISPDGKWLAYVSLESGDVQVYITSFPRAGAKWQVSVGGGSQPRWRGDGKELYFSQHDNTILAVDVNTSGNTVVMGTPHVLFHANMQGGPSGQFDVSRDGKHFLLNSLGTQGSSSPLTLVTNWPEELRK